MEEKAIEPLKADVELAEGYRIPSNIANLTNLAREKADQFRGLRAVGTAEDYRAMKAYRADMNRFLKQVDAERKRVKVAWTAPLTTFEAEVKSATRELTEVRDQADRLAKEYEQARREEKRDRLREYWEDEYPVYALCTGEAEEPLVPFDSVFDPDWTARMGEVGDDSKARAAMDAIAEGLAKGESVLERFEPVIRAAALSELYRTRDLETAVHRAEQETRRRADAMRVQRVQEPLSTESTTGPVEDAPEPTQAPQGAARRFVITIECESQEEKDRVVAVMKANGIHGKVRMV